LRLFLGIKIRAVFAVKWFCFLLLPFVEPMG